MSGKKIVLLNGSARKRKTSYSFALTLKQLAESNGNSAEILNILDYFTGAEKLDDFKSIISASHILGLVTPVYLDWLPYPVIWFFERLSADCKDELRDKYFFAVTQCGFMEIDLLRPSIESCRFFARSVDMVWLGGLAYPGGSMINGSLMEDLGKRGKKITAGFKMALEDVVQGKPISPGAQDIIALKIPRFLFRPLSWYGNYVARKNAKANGVVDLSREYYLDDSV